MADENPRVIRRGRQHVGHQGRSKAKGVHGGEEMRAEEQLPPAGIGYGQPSCYGPRPGDPRWRRLQVLRASKCPQHVLDLHGMGPVRKYPSAAGNWT